MAITLPAGCRWQHGDTVGTGSDGSGERTVAAEGPRAALKGLFAPASGTAALQRGAEVEAGWLAKSWQLQRLPGQLGLLTVSCVPDAGQTASAPNPIRTVWKVASVRADMPILGYCGPSEGVNPQRTDIEMWMRESTSLADQLKYRADDGSVVELSPASKALAAKIRAGVQSVMRFHPAVTRVRTYAAYVGDFDGLGRVGSLPNGAPAVGAYQWLKVRDDADQDPDGNWSRTETWWGAQRWDPDLYGPNAWPVPYEDT